MEQVILAYGVRAEEQLTNTFIEANATYPPLEITLLALKNERVLELWGKDEQGYHWIKDYSIRGASGTSGPKLREGDRQVPEGFYHIIGLNPNSRFHLSLKLNYPNEFDLMHANQEGRDQPGSNIFIHGKAASVGCVAIGDPAIEELFTLVYRIGKNNARVLIAPVDPRRFNIKKAPHDPEWVTPLYAQLTSEFSGFKRS